MFFFYKISLCRYFIEKNNINLIYSADKTFRLIRKMDLNRA